MKLANHYLPEKNRVAPNALYQHYQIPLDIALRETPQVDHERESVTETEFRYDLSDEERTFYEKLYVPFGKYQTQEGDVDLVELFGPQFSRRLQIGENEKDMLDFLIASRRLLALVSPVGQGKTTLLRYVFRYLMTQSEALRQRVFPLYISAEAQLPLWRDIRTEEQVEAFIVQEAVAPYLRKIVAPFSAIDKDEFWTYLKKVNHFSSLADDEHAWAISYKDAPKELFTRIAEARRATKQDPLFPFFAAKYVGNCKKKLILLILDDIDLLPDYAHRAILEALPRFTAEYGIRTIVALRAHTWAKLIADRDGVLDTVDPIQVNLEPPSTQKYLKRRVEAALDLAAVKPFSYVSLGQVQITQADARGVLKNMINLLIKKKPADVLEHICRQNLRKMTVLVKLYLQSGHMDATEVAEAIMKARKTDDATYEPALWVLLTAVITCNYATFFSNASTARVHDCMLNLYCNGESSVNNLNVRLQLLQYLAKLSRTETRSACELIDRYKEIFGEVGQTVHHAVRRLMDCMLIVSPEIYKVVNDEDVYKIGHLSISNTGRYFLTEFRNYFEYLSFMKDDADLGANPKNMLDCIAAPGFARRYAETSKFLELVYEQERNMVTRLTVPKRTLFRDSFMAESGERWVAHEPVRHMIEYGERRNIRTATIDCYRALYARMAEDRLDLLGENGP